MVSWFLLSVVVVGRCCKVTVKTGRERSGVEWMMKVGKFMRAPICPSHAMFLFAASRFNLLVRARTPRSEIILLRRGNANSHAPSDIHNTTPLIPHCLRVPSTPLPPPPPLFLLVNYFPSSRRPPLLPSFLDGEKNSRGESLSTGPCFFSFTKRQN